MITWYVFSFDKLSEVKNKDDHIRELILRDKT